MDSQVSATTTTSRAAALLREIQARQQSATLTHEQTDLVDLTSRPRWLWEEAKKLPSLPGRLAERRHQDLLGQQLLVLVELLPSNEQLQRFYRATSLDDRRNVLGDLDVVALKGFLRKHADAHLTQEPASGVREATRILVERVVGTGPAEELRRRCRALYLNQHPDHVGQLDYGTKLANIDAQLLFELLHVVRTTLNDESKVTSIYTPCPPQRGTPDRVAVGFGALLAVAGFFFARRA